MNVRDYLEILWRRKWAILLTTFVTVAVAALVTYLQVPRYSASAIVRVAQTASGSVDYADYVYAERLMNTYTEILNSRPVMVEVIRRLQLSISPEDLVDNVKVEVLLNTELLKITAEDEDPTQARNIADVLASLLVERSLDMYFGGGKSAREIVQEQLTAVEDTLEQLRSNLQDLLADPEADEEKITANRGRIRLEEELYTNLLIQYEEARIKESSRSNSISIVEPAMRPIKPSTPRWELNLALAILVGLLGGMTLVLLAETLNPLIRSLRDLDDEASLPTLGSIPKLSPASRDGRIQTVWSEESDSIGQEAFRLLRTNLLATGSTLCTLLVTSAEPRAGKSTVVAHLASSLSQTGKLVAVVDCDMRAPALHRLLGVSNEFGLSDVLLGRSDLEHAMQFTQMTNLRVLPAGGPTINPVELLSSPAMRTLVEKLANAYDVVFFDCPPLLAVADTSVLASMVDGVLLVAASDQTATRSMWLALRQLQKVGAKPLGVVLNRAEAGDGYYYGYRGKKEQQRPRVGSVARRRLVIVSTLAVASVLVYLLPMGGGSALNLPNGAEHLSEVAATSSGPTTLITATRSLPPPTPLPVTATLSSPAISDHSSTTAVVMAETASPSVEVPRNTLPGEETTPFYGFGTYAASFTTQTSGPAGLRQETPTPLPSVPPGMIDRPDLPAPSPASVRVEPAPITHPWLLNPPDVAVGTKAASDAPATLPAMTPPTASPTPTGTPFSIRTGVIFFRSVPLYTDPNNLESAGILLPANIRVEILDEVQGARINDSNRWYQVRWQYGMEKLTGYVPAGLMILDQ